MVHIGICDANQYHRAEMADILTSLFFEVDEIKIWQYGDGKEIIDAIEREEFYVDLLFLEILLPEVDGLKLGAYLLQCSHRPDLIYMTELKEYVLEGYRYHAFDFLVKPLSLRRLEDVVGRYIHEKIQKEKEYLTVNIRGSQQRIRLDKILYFEGRGRKIGVVMKDGDMEFYSKITDLVDLLERKGFIRIHQSYMVNGSVISRCSAVEVTLLDGTILPLSRRYSEKVRNYLRENEGFLQK